MSTMLRILEDLIYRSLGWVLIKYYALNSTKISISKETPLSIFNCPVKIYPILFLLHENLDSASSLTAAQLQEMHVHTQGLP